MSIGIYLTPHFAVKKAIQGKGLFCKAQAKIFKEKETST